MPPALSSVIKRRLSRYKEPSIFKKAFANTGLLLALITSVLYLYGYTYLSSFYQYFNLPIDIINPDFYTILLYGFTQTLKPLIIIFSTLYVIPFLLEIISDLRRFSLIDKVAQFFHVQVKNIQSVYGLLALFLLLLFILSINSAGEEGKNRAIRYFTDSGPILTVKHDDSNAKGKNMPSILGLLYHTADVYFLFDPYPINGKKPDVFIVDAKAVKELRIIGAMRDKENIEQSRSRSESRN